MDTLLKNGDHVRDGRGFPTQITGVPELLQQALLRLTVKKGSFCFDPALGSRLYTLQRSGNHLQKEALLMVKEALCDMTQAAVRAGELSQEGENLRLHVLLSLQNENVQLEVPI